MATGNFGKDIDGLAEIFSKEVSAELHLETGNDLLDAVVGAEQGFVVAGVGNDDVGAGNGGNIGDVEDGGFEGVKVLAVLGADGNNGYRVISVTANNSVTANGTKGRLARYGVKIGLIPDNEEGAALTASGDVGDLGFGGESIKEPDDNTGLLYGGVGAVDTDALNGVGGLTDAGCIDEAELYATNVNGVLDRVASGAVYVTDDGTFFF